MIPLRQAVSSSIGRKLITALTGIGLIVFTIFHLLGNLTLLSPSPELFNLYAFKLHSLGALVYIAEIGLLVLFGAHIVNGILLKKRNREARPVAYAQWKSKGAAQSNFASRNMAISGFILLVFLILHIWHFRFGPGVPDGYVTDVNGETARDLYKLVWETFQSPWVVGIYTAAMIFFWLHIKHGFWSAFQSLGAMNPRWNRPISVLGMVTAAILAVGFLVLPLWIYFDVGGALQ